MDDEEQRRQDQPREEAGRTDQPEEEPGESGQRHEPEPGHEEHNE